MPDLGVAFTARNLIRLASLFPDIVDLRQASRDLELLVTLLSSGTCSLPPDRATIAGSVTSNATCYVQVEADAPVPDVRTGQLIEEVLRRARRKQVLPPLSRPASPRYAQTQNLDQTQQQARTSAGPYSDQPFSASNYGPSASPQGGWPASAAASLAGLSGVPYGSTLYPSGGMDTSGVPPMSASNHAHGQSQIPSNMGMPMGTAGQMGQMGQVQGVQGQGMSASPAHDMPSVESQPLFDFGLAEELLTTGGAGFGPGAGGMQVSIVAPVGLGGGCRSR